MNATVAMKRAHHFVGGLLTPDSVVIDLGANRGHFSNEVHADYGCNCFAIEAVPSLCESIKANPKIQKFNVAICPEEGPVTFHVSSQEESGSMSDLPADMVRETITVDGMTLESFLRARNIGTVDLLKIDIEGAEIGLLRSVDDETLLRIRQITIEFHDFLPYFNQKEDIRWIKRRLRRLGFECIRYSMSCHADVLFINRANSGLTAGQVAYLKWIDRFVRAGRRFIERYRA